MKQQAVWLLLLLAGCGFGNQGDSPEAACQRQAYNDPAVKHLTVQSLGSASTDPERDFAYTKALHDATAKCLRDKGVEIRGGVEPVRRN